MDAIYTYRHYGQDNRPRLQFPKRTGRRTTYAQWLAYQYGLHHDGELPAIGVDAPLATAFVNHGRWLWQCPACLTAVQVCDDNTVDGADLICCPACFSQGFVQPEFPDARAEIEAELLRQPGYRHNAPFRNWEPGWGIDYLQERTAAAQAKIAAGETFIRSASVGTPRTWAVGEVLTAANMNTFVREIQKDLIGTNGAVELLHGMRPGSFTTAQVQALSGIEDGVMLYNSTTQRHEYFVGGNRRGFAGVHTSGLFAAGEVVTVTHGLGFAPTSFQLLYERVGASAQHGHGNGDRVYVGEGGLPPGFAVFDVTATSYKVAVASRRDPLFWALDSNDDEIYTIDPGNVDSTENGLQTTISSVRLWGLTLIGDKLYAVEITLVQRRILTIDMSDFSYTASNLPSGVGSVNPALTTDGTDIWLLRRSGGIWRINPADTDSEAGVYGEVGTIPGTGYDGIGWLNGELWVASLHGSSGSSIRKVDHTNPSNVGVGFGTDFNLPNGINTNSGDIVGYDNALWLCTVNGDIWKINPANPDSETGGFGFQGRSYSMGGANGIALQFREPNQRAFLTATSGAEAGSSAEITVDNDASAGGWGARLLAFA